MTKILVHSFVPTGRDGNVGGFDWGHRGTPAEDAVRAQFDLDTDTSHRDYMPSHIHRLLELDVHRSLGPADVSDFIEFELLDRIEQGKYDAGPELIAKHDPTTQGETS